ncbi:MAG: hypothetical protein JWR38_1478 [Mucilaginibacter sp.]|nr:hypothetical protein [Mucilaginibacter sp.]
MKKLINIRNGIDFKIAFLIIAIFFFAGNVSAQQPVAIKNIVLVHGAFVDGSG